MWVDVETSPLERIDTHNNQVGQFVTLFLRNLPLLKSILCEKKVITDTNLIVPRVS